MTKDRIIELIKKTIKDTDPQAEVILFGSYARDQETNRSDIDVLILLNKDSISLEDEKKIAYPLYDIEFSTGIIISPIILSKKDWEIKHKITPFYDNIKNEGVLL